MLRFLLVTVRDYWTHVESTVVQINIVFQAELVPKDGLVDEDEDEMDGVHSAATV